MTDVRTYRARSMQEALEFIRQDLGTDAVILSSRERQVSGFWPWSRSHRVEVTAGRDLDLPELKTRTTRPHREECNRSNSSSPGKSADRGARQVGRNVAYQASVIDFGSSPAAENFGRSSLDEDTNLQAQIASLQSILAQRALLSHADGPSLTTDVSAVCLRLLNADASEPTLHRISQQFQREFPWCHPADVAACLPHLTEVIERQFQCGGEIKSGKGKQSVVALVGPTGVGKTTTIARLAAHFKLTMGFRVCLVTVDRDNLPAVEQLRELGDKIDIVVQAVADLHELQQTIAQLPGFDLILVDTPGYGPQDTGPLQLLGKLHWQDIIDEVHLVLSLATSPRWLADAWKNYEVVRPESVILTKLDESPDCGSLLELVPELDSPISYLSIGQDISNEIQIANRRRLSHLVLGIEKVSLEPIEAG